MILTEKFYRVEALFKDDAGNWFSLGQKKSKKMKSIFDKVTRDEIIVRINSINNESVGLWGKMNVYQMLKHCTLWEEMILGKLKVKRMFAGRIIGKMALKDVLRNEEHLRKNSPTSPELKITETTGNISLQKAEWFERIKEYEHYNYSNFIHPFFGKMTNDQVGLFVYKHADHHLRQFGA
jgi:hypothetical protein